MTTESQNQLGKIIDDARKRRGYTIRALARDMDITHGYVRDLIQGYRVPSEIVILKLCRALELDYDELMTLAGRVGESVNRHARGSICFGQFIRWLADTEITNNEISDLRRIYQRRLDRRHPQDSSADQDHSRENGEQQMFW